MATIPTQIRIDTNVKEQATLLFDELGMISPPVHSARWSSFCSSNSPKQSGNT